RPAFHNDRRGTLWTGVVDAAEPPAQLDAGLGEAGAVAEPADREALRGGRRYLLGRKMGHSEQGAVATHAAVDAGWAIGFHPQGLEPRRTSANPQSNSSPRSPLGRPILTSVPSGSDTENSYMPQGLSVGPPPGSRSLISAASASTSSIYM